MNNRTFGIYDVFQNTDSMLYKNKINTSNPFENNFLQAENGDIIQDENGTNLEIDF